MGNAATHEKPLQWRVSCVPAAIYYANIVTEYHNKRETADTIGNQGIKYESKETKKSKTE